MNSRYLRSKFNSEDPTQESVLLRSIRSALRGSNPGRDWQHTVFYDVSPENETGDWVEELHWDEERVVLCAGGVIQKQWSFPHEGQPVQWACNGWLLQAGGVAASRSSGHYTNDSHSGLSRERERDNPARATFGPFERAEQERRREIEPESRVRATFVFLRSVGWIYLSDGVEYTFSLPFIVRKAWPLHPHGVIIQRVLEPTEFQEAELTGDETLPTVFSLISPLAEATVVDHAANIVGGFHSVPLSLVHDDDASGQISEPLSAGEVILWVSHQGHGEDSDLLVTVNPERRQLSVWRYAYVKLGDIPFSQAHSRFRKKRASMAAGAPDNQRQALVTNEGFGWRVQPPPEDHPLEAMPALSSTTVFAPLAAGTSRTHVPLLDEQRPPSEWDRLTADLNRMARGGRMEGDMPLSPADYTRMRSTHWITRLHTLDLTENDSADWTRIGISVFDQRFDGQVDQALLGVCRPASGTVTILSVTKSSDKTVQVIQIGEHPGVSIASMRIMRSNVDDLLVAEPNGALTVLTHGLRKYNASTVGIAGAIPYLLSRTSLPPGAGSMEVDDASASVQSNRVVALREPIRSSVTIELLDGSVSRASIDFVPKDLLTKQCLEVLALTLPADWAFGLHVTFTDAWRSRRLSCEPEAEFGCFKNALLTILEVESYQKDPAGSSPWERLACSTSYGRLEEDLVLSGLQLPQRHFHKHPPTSKRPHALLAPVLNALHMLGEDLRLMVHRHHEVHRLANLICLIANIIRPEWADYWKRFCPNVSLGWVCDSSFVDDRLPVWPPDMTAMFYGRINNPDWRLPWYDIRKLASQFKLSPSYAYGRLEPLAYLCQLTLIYRCLADKTVEDSRKRAENAMHLMVSHQIGQTFLNALPLGLAAPLREAARTCQLAPGHDWPTAAYDFVGRNDLAEGANVDLSVLNTAGYRSIKEFLGNRQRPSIRSLVHQATSAAAGDIIVGPGVEVNVDDFTRIRFGQDKRLDEVSRMLRSSEVPKVRMVERPELSEHDQAKEQQNHVLRIAERTLALPLGRAMFTFGSVPTVTREAYTIPKIEFSIHLQPQNVTIAPEQNKIPLDSLNWGDFHNGVAAALRISPSSNVIESSWIKFNRPSELTPEHAGFLYGLGLTGHLREMLTWHTFGYLTPKHDLTSIGMLLGLSAANVGSGNRHVTKLLAVHTPALLPTPTIDLNVPLITQAAGLVGLGLLYMGSKNRRMAEVCLKQISRNDLTQPDLSNEHREAYAMAAALAFGMVTLGQGSVVPIPADEALVSELRILIHGEAPSHMRSRRTRAAFDINLTSPAATIALGLMYLKTESQEVADILTIPDTIMALNRIPPNFLLLRTLSRNLILWDRITPTREWVDAQLPAYIAKAVDERSQGKEIDDAIDLAFYNIVAGCCFAIALKYAGTAREEPYLLLINYYDTFSRMAYTNGPAYDHKIKRHAIRDGLNLISISLNIIMAGTGEINCLRRLRYSYGMYNQAMRYGTHMATHMSLGLLFLGRGRYTLGSSDAAVACLISAFFPRFPPVSSDNKSYLQALRHLWVLAVEPRCLIARDVDTKEIVYLPVKIKVKEGPDVEMAQLISPTLIPDFDKVLSIRVDTPRYWPFYLDLANVRRHKDSLLRSQTIYVKRRTAFLSYLEDPKGSRSLFVRSGSSSGDAATLDFPRLTVTKGHPAGDLNQFISSFSNDPFFLAFADHFCRNDSETDPELLFNAYCRASLLDGILQDKPQTLQSHLLLYQYRTMKPSSRYFHLRLQDLRFAVDFYSKVYDRRFSGRSENNPRIPLIRDGTLSGTLYALDQHLEIIRSNPAFLTVLGAYARGESVPTTAMDIIGASAFAWYLLRGNVPVSTLLGVLQGLAQRAHAACVDTPPPEGSGGDATALERGVREVLHATGTQMTTTLGSGWAMRSLDEVLHVWRAGPITSRQHVVSEPTGGS
ncbi:hypothetical protein B0F90DRAFT_1818336 [Multifurca ochricompacta]|uniref:Anaphase-promoting complex subunit 1 n=1 Tax=Multifurca ochricompacta TaxID=376703 RepID=A0AAD4M2J2_9AGAM|nr:hypothetical protein B0F90DRAFT_1818336 [Multifurca ochricompacta]